MTARTGSAAGGWMGQTGESLAARWGVPEVHASPQVGSTNDVARRLADAGAPAGTTVVAEEQVAGRGRVGRPWSSPARLGLWLSIVARPSGAGNPGALPLLAGLAAATALDGFLPAPAVRLKWPNDLWIERRKVGGVLCEGAWSGGAPAFVIVGVGLNVLHEREDFPPEIRADATSLRLAGAADASLLDVASRLVPALYRVVATEPELDDAALAALGERDALRGHPVVVSDPGSGAELGRGIARGIGPGGALLVRDGASELRAFHSGTVRVDTDSQLQS